MSSRSTWKTYSRGAEGADNRRSASVTMGRVLSAVCERICVPLRTTTVREGTTLVPSDMLLCTRAIFAGATVRALRSSAWRKYT